MPSLTTRHLFSVIPFYINIQSDDDPSTGNSSSAGSETVENGGSGTQSGGSGIIPTPTDPEDDQPD